MYFDWKTKQFDEDKCQGIIVNKNNGKLKIIGEFKDTVGNGAQVMYWAANPYNTRYSYHGSGIAYSSPDIYIYIYIYNKQVQNIFSTIQKHVQIMVGMPSKKIENVQIS